MPRARFGKKLFFDPKLSKSGNVSCASCHSPGLSFTDGRKRAIGMKEGTRNTPTLINVFSGHWFFWDGRADSLSAQALGPLESTLEHNTSRGQIAWLVYRFYKNDYETVFGPFPKALQAKLASMTVPEAMALPRPKCLASECAPLDKSLATYAVSTISDFKTQNTFILKAGKLGIKPQELLSRAWIEEAAKAPDQTWYKNFDALTAIEKKEINDVFVNVGRALSVYQKGLLAVDSPFDRFVQKLSNGNTIAEAMSDEFSLEQWQGFKHFVSSGCANCHNGPNFTDQQFHNIGLAWSDPMDMGRAVGLKRLSIAEFGCLEPELESCQEREYIQENNNELVGAFKTPTLRNLDTSKPYMHDGRFDSIDAVLDHYSEPPNEAAIGHRSESLQTLRLEPEDRKNLLLFLKSLNATVVDLTDR
jgi:cytochrome c peroxidase